MLGAACVCRHAQQRFVICQVGLVCALKAWEGLSAKRGKPKPFVMSDKHWEWCSMRRLQNRLESTGGALGGERGETAGRESVWAMDSPSVLFSLFHSPSSLAASLLANRASSLTH